MTADQSDRANRDRQNDSEHDRMLCDILAVLLPPSSAKELSHPGPNLELPRTQALEYSDWTLNCFRIEFHHV